MVSSVIQTSKQHCYVLSAPCGELSGKGLCNNFPASRMGSIHTSWTWERDNRKGKEKSKNPLSNAYQLSL